MTREEVIEQARRLYPGLDLAPRDIKHWSYWGLIPKPKRRGLGQGKGMTADYPEDAPAQLAAAAFALSQGYTRTRVSQARRIALGGELAIPLEAWRLHDRAVMTLAAVQTYATALARARAGSVLDSSSLPGSIRHKWELSPHTTPSGKILYHCSVCGLYDPAPVKPKFEDRECGPGLYADRWEVVPREDGNGCIVRVR